MRTDESDQFVITGSQTSGFKNVTGQHFTKIIGVDIDNNFVRCVGPVTASSETLTHAAFYKASSDIQAVVHVHNREAWEKLIKNITAYRY